MVMQKVSGEAVQRREILLAWSEWPEKVWAEGWDRVKPRTLGTGQIRGGQCVFIITFIH